MVRYAYMQPRSRHDSRDVLMGHYSPYSLTLLPIKPNPTHSPSHPREQLLLEPQKQNERPGYRYVHTLEIPVDDLFSY